MKNRYLTKVHLMKKLFYIIFFLALLFALFSAQAQKVWYANNGNQIGTGTISDPFGAQTAFSGGNNLMKGSDTVRLSTGIYGPVKYTYNPSNYVTYTGEGVVFQGDDKVNVNGTIEVHGDYFRLYGVTIRGANPNRDARLPGWRGSSNGISLLGGENIEIISNDIYDTSASGIYKSASCKNVKILYNRIKYPGYLDSDRPHHHCLYIQNSKGSECIIRGNILAHSLQYGIQVWHQSGPAKQESKLINVKIEDNIFYMAQNRPIHYGGNNVSDNGAIVGNSVYNSPENAQGVSFGYVTQSDSKNFNVTISGNYIQDCRLSLLNIDKTLKGITGNTIVYPGEVFWIGQDGTKDFPIISNVIDNNTYFTDADKPFRHYADEYNESTGKIERLFNISYSTQDWKFKGPDKNSTVQNFKFAPQENRVFKNIYEKKLYVAIHNPIGQDNVDINLSNWIDEGDSIRVYDFDSYLTGSIYQGIYNKSISINTNFDAIDPIFGNMPAPVKTPKYFYALIIEYGDRTQGKDPIDPPQPDKAPNVIGGQLIRDSGGEYFQVTTDPKVTGSVTITPVGGLTHLENGEPYSAYSRDGFIENTGVEAKGVLTYHVVAFSQAQGKGEASETQIFNVDYGGLEPPVEPPIDPPVLPTDYVTKEHFDSEIAKLKADHLTEFNLLIEEFEKVLNELDNILRKLNIKKTFKEQ